MALFKKIFAVLIGTSIMGLGVAFFEASSLGFDGLSCLVVSIQKLINTNYSIAYLLVNLIFFIIMFIFLKDQIGIGTIINFLLTGVFSNFFMIIFKYIHIIHSEYLLVNILFGIFGVGFLAFGIALYANANLGVTPYDSIPLIFSKYFKIFKRPIKYHIARKIADGSCILLGVIVGIVILKQHYILGINTLITFIFIGYIVSFASKIINKYIYQTTNELFK
jgi:uncharacterized membrane protein YczE